MAATPNSASSLVRPCFTDSVRNSCIAGSFWSSVLAGSSVACVEMMPSSLPPANESASLELHVIPT